MELQSEHNFGMRVSGRTRGRTGLKVVLRVTDPEAGQLVGNLQELRDEVQIQVHRHGYSFLMGTSYKALMQTLFCLTVCTNVVIDYLYHFVMLLLLGKFCH